MDLIDIILAFRNLFCFQYDALIDYLWAQIIKISDRCVKLLESSNDENVDSVCDQVHFSLHDLCRELRSYSGVKNQVVYRGLQKTQVVNQGSDFLPRTWCTIVHRSLISQLDIN